MGLYILDHTVPRLVACSGVTTPFETHCLLGHPSFPLLKKLCPQFSSLSSLECESCHSSPRVNKRVNALFELVYYDAWGSCQVVSLTGFQ